MIMNARLLWHCWMSITNGRTCNNTSPSECFLEGLWRTTVNQLTWMNLENDQYVCVCEKWVEHADLYSALYTIIITNALKYGICQQKITQFYLPSTCLIHSWNDPCLTSFPSHTVKSYFGQYSFLSWPWWMVTYHNSTRVNDHPS